MSKLSHSFWSPSSVFRHVSAPKSWMPGKQKPEEKRNVELEKMRLLDDDALNETPSSSLRDVREHITASLEGIKNLAAPRDGNRPDTAMAPIDAKTVDALIAGFEKATKKIDDTVWDVAPKPGWHKNPFHFFRKYCRKTLDDTLDSAGLKSHVALREAYLHIDNAVSELEASMRDLTTRPMTPKDAKAFRLRCDRMKEELETARDAGPKSKNRFNIKATITGVLTCLSLSSFAAGLIFPPLAPFLWPLSGALIVANAIHAICNQRFYQRDAGWDKLDDFVVKLSRKTIEKLEMNMNNTQLADMRIGIANTRAAIDTGFASTDAKLAELSRDLAKLRALHGLECPETQSAPPSDSMGKLETRERMANDLRSAQSTRQHPAMHGAQR